MRRQLRTRKAWWEVPIAPENCERQKPTQTTLVKWKATFKPGSPAMGSLKGTISAEACPSLRLTANAGRRLGVKYQRAWQSLKVVPGSGDTVSNKEGGGCYGLSRHLRGGISSTHRLPLASRHGSSGFDSSNNQKSSQTGTNNWTVKCGFRAD